ncbi:MAG: hypothetical protein ACOZQL_39295 [Myxococcota bacterium]
MIWLAVALLSGVVAGVGFWRGTPAGLGGEAIPASAGVIFSLLLFRAQTLVKDRATLGKQGGWPMNLGGALALTATLAAAVDLFIWIDSRRSTMAVYALPVAILSFLLLAITALRLSVDSPRRTHFLALALASAVNAAAATAFFASQLSAIRQ